MGGVAGGRLASAISGAGGLGMIGIGTAGSVELIERESAIPRQGPQPFGIGLLGWAVDQEPLLLDAALDAQPILISLGFANVSPWVHLVHDAGILLATQVYDVQGARDAQTAGVDIIIARGSEGGGHGLNNVSTLPLLQAVLEEVEIPVLAAGSIGSARGLAAVLAAGASGAWIGTAFLLCPEALTPAAAHSRIVRANETDTVYTRSVDAAMGFAWPTQFGERVCAIASPNDGREMRNTWSTTTGRVRPFRGLATRTTSISRRLPQGRVWVCSRTLVAPKRSSMASPTAPPSCWAGGATTPPTRPENDAGGPATE